MSTKPHDFRVRDEGTLILLWPVSDEATDWVNEHIDPEATRWAGAIVIERRYFPAIFAGLAADGLTGRYS